MLLLTIMKKLLFTVFWAFAFVEMADAQSNPNAKFFLQLNNGKMIYTDHLTLEEPFLRGSYLWVDGTDKYKLSEVKWYRSPDGTFKRFSTGVFDKGWYKQEEEGKINVYSRIVTSSSGNNYYGRGIYMTPTYTTTKVEYFQTGDTPPQHLRYLPLKALMADHPGGLEVLNKGHKRAVTKGVLYGAGIAMLLAGAVLTVNSTETNPITGGNSVQVSPLVYLGVATCLVPIFIPSPTRDYRRAITVFNVK